MSYSVNDCSCNGGMIYGIAQCRACGSGACVPSGVCADANQKRIQNTVRIPSSEYTMNLGALNVYQRPSQSHACVNWDQTSDRAQPGVVRRHVPTRGNSTKSSITRMRPGSTSAPGSGVDIKHGSYARYLARLKGKSALRTQQRAAGVTTTHGNKRRKFGIVAYSAQNCQCFTQTCTDP